MSKIDMDTIHGEGLALAVGKNFESSAHVDQDMGYTFSGRLVKFVNTYLYKITGSFHMKGQIGNSFIFSEYQAKIVFKNDMDDLTLFMFNPRVQVKHNNSDLKENHSLSLALR